MTDLKFEDSLARLEQIVSQLESGHLPLEESLKSFEEGIARAEAVGGAATMVMPTACALEMIHTYSLIHDDLPAMDDDDYRRGRLTNHKVFGDAIAILAGDALLALAFRLVAENADLVSDRRVIRDVVAEIADAAGTVGMVGGQVVDIESEGKATSAETLEYIHRHKTAALIRASLRVGARLAGGDAKAVAAITEAGSDLGLAFQIVDDILDVEGSLEELGKTAGSDERKQKATYPGIHGREERRGDDRPRDRGDGGLRAGGRGPGAARARRHAEQVGARCQRDPRGLARRRAGGGGRRGAPALRLSRGRRRPAHAGADDQRPERRRPRRQRPRLPGVHAGPRGRRELLVRSPRGLRGLPHAQGAAEGERARHGRGRRGRLRAEPPEQQRRARSPHAGARARRLPAGRGRDAGTRPRGERVRRGGRPLPAPARGGHALERGDDPPLRAARRPLPDRLDRGRPGRGRRGGLGRDHA